MTNDLSTGLDHIRQSIEEIKGCADDPERAHGLESMLHQSILDLLARIGPAPWSNLAREALKTREIEFPRWMS